MRLSLIAIVVGEYDPAISFFVDALGFELMEDSPALTNDGRAKRWVVVRPPGAETGLLLAQADGEDQAAAVGRQAAGRVGFFLGPSRSRGVRLAVRAYPKGSGTWRVPISRSGFPERLSSQSAQRSIVPIRSSPAEAQDPRRDAS